MHEWFRRFAHRASVLAGNYITFLAALLLILAWAVTGPIFHYSETWQLVINTTTTIITFLMVFLIQNTQYRDAMAMHLKLDELIRSTDQADNRMIQAEDEADRTLEELKRDYEQLCDDLDQVHSRVKAARRQ